MTRFVVAALVLATACASTGASPASGPRQEVIAATELAGHTGTARQVIERLRPRFLRVRGPSSVSNPNADRIVVYVDDSRMGGVEVLDQISVAEISEIRYMSASDATSRYGTGHAAGAIIIVRR